VATWTKSCQISAKVANIHIASDWGSLVIIYDSIGEPIRQDLRIHINEFPESSTYVYAQSFSLLIERPYDCTK